MQIYYCCLGEKGSGAQDRELLAIIGPCGGGVKKGGGGWSGGL